MNGQRGAFTVVGFCAATAKRRRSLELKLTNDLPYHLPIPKRGAFAAPCRLAIPQLL